MGIIRRFAKGSIKARLTFVTISFTLLATLTLVAASLFQLQRVTRANMLQSIEFNLHLVAELIHADITYMERLRFSASILPQTIEFLTAEDYARPGTLLHARLSEDMMQNPAVRHLRRLVITDSQLTRRVQVGILMDIVPLMPHLLYRLGDFTETNAPIWTGIEYDPFAVQGREPIFSVISPIRHGRAVDAVGYVYLAVSTNAILAPLSGYPFLEQGGLYLTMGGVSYRIVDNRFVEVPLYFYNARPGVDATLHATTEVITFNNGQGARYMAVSNPIGNTGFVLTQTFPAGLVLQEIMLVVRLLLLICVGVFVLGVLIAIYLSRSINRPVRQIERQVKAIAAGNFTPDTVIEWDNEFGEIGRNINQLARDMEALMDSRLEDEKKKHELEYKILQSQISPHFLYNALNSIKWMASIQNATGIAEMTVSLSRLLMSVAKVNKTVVPLSRELALLEDFFVISRYRYGGSITTYVDVPDEFLDCPIPIFTLQPLAENAIFHGLEAGTGIGTVSVSAVMPAEGVLEITVEDSGIGMDEATIAELFQEKTGDNPGLFKKVGVSNVHTRLQYEFGPEYGLKIESRPGEYTRAIVSVPFEEKRDLQ